MEGDAPTAEDKATLRSLFARLLRGNSSSTCFDLARTLGPALIVSAIVILVALHFVRPAPPNNLTIASGAPGSRFNLAAEQYKKILAHNGITLKIITTEG